MCALFFPPVSLPRTAPPLPLHHLCPAGEAYTEEEFVAYYGGSAEWDAAALVDVPDKAADVAYAVQEPESGADVSVDRRHLAATTIQAGARGRRGCRGRG